MPGLALKLLDAAAFWLFRQSVLILFRLLFGYRVRGLVPRTGPCVVVANHTSFLDALLLGGVTARRMRFVMTDEYANVRGLRWFLRWNRVLLVREHARSSRKVFADVQAVLEAGGVVAIFPEGGISQDGRLQPLQPGVLLMAERAGVPLVPVGISGAFRALPRHRSWPRPATITCRVGEAIRVEELLPPERKRKEALLCGAERLRLSLAELVESSLN